MKWLHKEEKFEDTLIRLADEGFVIRDCEFAGDKCYLIYPANMGVEWNEDNLIYRSSIWNEDGEPVSLSWKKFFNWNERCDLAPKPVDITECSLANKEDGSTLIVSNYKGEFIVRTRGTTDIRTLDNGYEYDFLMEKYKNLMDSIRNLDHWECSIIFEWETPNNKIIIDYGDEPKLVLTGIISHNDYKYCERWHLEVYKETFNIEIPKLYTFESFDDMESAMSSLKGVEGICVYYNNFQDIKKMKTDEYLMLHSIKFKLGYKALIDMILDEQLELDDFKKHIEDKFDHEGLTFVEKLIEQIYQSKWSMKLLIETVFTHIMCNYDTSNKKIFAQLVMGDETFKKFSGFMFKMYDMETYDIEPVINSHEGLRRKYKEMILEDIKEEENESK